MGKNRKPEAKKRKPKMHVMPDGSMMADDEMMMEQKRKKKVKKIRR